MAAAVAPVELPTGRRSYYNTTTTVDIHDPNWIPVLDSAAYKPPLSPTEKEVSTYPPPPASFSLFPAQASSPKPRPGFSHSYSKSALAPESVGSDSDSRSQSPQDSIEPLPSIGIPFQAPQDATREHNRQTTSTTAADSEEKISVHTEGAGDVGSSPNSEEHETASVVEERELSHPLPPPEPFGEAMVNPSTRSSMISTMTKKSTVLPPTSKYNRKHVASVATTPGRPLVPSLPQTPQESPRLGPTVIPTTLPVAQLPPSPKLPPTEAPRQTEQPQKLQPAKSTASERRQRALHSHPSNVSLRSQRNSSSDDAEIIPRPPSIRNKSRKSTDSRATTPRSTIYDFQVPTPAPTTPLPQLPPGAIRRPSTREGNSQRAPQAPIDEPVPSTVAPLRPFEHAEMASFMAEKNTIICRRFDAVHVRLLLCLQDEISQLEKELLKLESPNSAGSPSEKMLQKTRILRELRKVVAEYDHLFTTWSKMQANKASESTTKELKEWLEKPGTSIEAGLGINTQQDLQWLENTKDLSSIELGDKAAADPAIDKEKASQGAAEGGGGGGGATTAAAGGGFMALFGCGGKRK